MKGIKMTFQENPVGSYLIRALYCNLSNGTPEGKGHIEIMEGLISLLRKEISDHTLSQLDYEKLSDEVLDQMTLIVKGQLLELLIRNKNK